MNTMEEVDTWYETEMNKAKLEGQLEGEARGKELEKQEIALKMLRTNISLETIEEVTGLTREQLKKLSSSLTE